MKHHSRLAPVNIDKGLLTISDVIIDDVTFLDKNAEVLYASDSTVIINNLSASNLLGDYGTPGMRVLTVAGTGVENMYISNSTFIAGLHTKIVNAQRM